MTDARDKEQGMKTKGETREQMGTRIKDAEERHRQTNPDEGDKSAGRKTAKAGGGQR
jgi:hypothetical protein